MILFRIIGKELYKFIFLMIKQQINNIIHRGQDIYINRKLRKMSFNASLDDKAINNSSILLTRQMMEQINKKWGAVIPEIKYGYVGYESYMQYCEFSPDFVPSAFYYPYIIRVMNPVNYYLAFENKCLYKSLFKEINQPETLGMRINDNYYCHNSLCSKQYLVDKLSEQSQPLIIKQSIDSCCGRNISIIAADTKKDEIFEIIDSYSSDFIIQSLIISSNQTAQFNPSSVNTFRISTLLLNGRISICSMAIKLGKPGNIVDNIGGDGGGIIIGVNSEGILNNWGITAKGEKRSKHNNINFGGIKINGFEKVLELAKDAHSQFPYCGIVGWDIALDYINNPVLIEANLWWPGTLLEQICSGPFFGERTDEVIEYLKSHKLPIRGL